MPLLRDVNCSTFQELNDDVVIFSVEMARVANNIDGRRCEVCNADYAGGPHIERAEKWRLCKWQDITIEDVAAYRVANRREPIWLGQFRNIQIEPIGTAVAANFIAVRWLIAFIG